MRQAQVKMLLARSSWPLPRLMEMGTADPTPMRSASAKLMMVNGIARFMAANAVEPRNCPTKTPSMVCHSAEASMLMAPGMAAVKKSRTGGVRANRWDDGIAQAPFGWVDGWGGKRLPGG